MSFWLVFLAALCAAAVFVAVAVALMVPLVSMVMRAVMSYMMKGLTSTSYLQNPFGAFSVLRKLDPQYFVETLMRAEQGKPLSRPLGTFLQLSPWQKLLFQPVYLRPRLPTPHDVDIDTGTIIGPAARRVLSLRIPLLITGMSYGGALTVRAKIALAKAANACGTATNSGEAYLAEEREAAERFILQYHRGLWPSAPQNDGAPIERCDALEIQLGQGAQAAASMVTWPNKQNAKMREVFRLDDGESARIGTRLKNVDSARDFIALVKRLRDATDSPIGVKVGVSQTIEQDLAVFLEAGVDFVTVDGAEGGTHGGPPILQDDVGLPTLYGIARVDDYLRAQGVRERVSVIAAGGMTTPGVFLKAMAIGADAVYLGTAAVLPMLAGQGARTSPGYPPYDLLVHAAPARLKDTFDIEKGAQHLSRYMTSCVKEMQYVAQSLGKTSLAAVDRSDLIALEDTLAERLHIPGPWGETTAEAHELPLLSFKEGANRDVRQAPH